MRHGKAKVIHQQPMKQRCVPLELLLLRQELRAGGEDAIGSRSHQVAFSLRRWYCPMLVLLNKRLWTVRTSGWPRKKENKEGKPQASTLEGEMLLTFCPKSGDWQGMGQQHVSFL